MSKLGEGDEAHVEEGFIAGYGIVDHFEHAFGAMLDFIAGGGIGRIDLAGGGVIGGHDRIVRQAEWVNMPAASTSGSAVVSFVCDWEKRCCGACRAGRCSAWRL